MSQLLITQLQNLVDPTCEPAAQQADLKVVLRVVKTVLRNFHQQLKSKCGVFIETLLAGKQHEAHSCQWRSAVQLKVLVLHGPMYICLVKLHHGSLSNSARYIT